MKKNEYGRTMIELLSVLAIVGVLSIVGLIGYNHLLCKQKVDALLHAIALETITINSAMTGKSFSSEDELNKFLSAYTTQTGEYRLTFRASPDGGDGFVTEITNLNGEPIKGKICRDLITKMAEQKFVSDVDFTLKDEETEDGSKEDITVRLNERYVNLEAVCGG